MDIETFKKKYSKNKIFSKISDEIGEERVPRKAMSFVFAISLVVLAVFIIGFFLTRSPKNFPEKDIFLVERGTTLRSVSHKLKEHNIIGSAVTLEWFIKLTGNRSIIAGDYLFDRPQSLLVVARRLRQGDFGDSRIRVVLHEGLTVEQMSEVLEEQLAEFNKNYFLSLAQNNEGYLFPSTYFFFPSTSTKEVYDTLIATFHEHVDELIPDIEASGHSINEILTMASIIEKESANNMTERKIISGILWKRIEIGMPLQVDAPFVYIIGKGSAELTREDLADDSPYNTYTNKGLPPTPIGNPGLASIKAALAPTTSSYLFYLHGKDGIVRYGTNFDEHLANKKMYIR